MLNIVTIVFNGQPFIEHHLPIFEQLSVPWKWVIIEGPANNGGSTAWCNPQKPGHSTDGTSEYIYSLSSHPNVRWFEGRLWESKDQMVQTALDEMDEPGVLLECDADEYWSRAQLEKIVELFESDSSLGAMAFFCRYFVGPDLICVGEDCWSNGRYDWVRAWKFEPGMKVVSHEPPKFDRMLCRMMEREETREHGLTFDHHAWTTEAQVAYKQRFYGGPYCNALEQWHDLQQCQVWPQHLRQWFPWCDDKVMVQRIDLSGGVEADTRDVNGLRPTIGAQRIDQPSSLPVSGSSAPPAQIFYHSGDLGDVLAALPAIRVLGGGHLLIGNGKDGQRESMEGARFDAIKPLLEVQPYIKSVAWSNDKAQVTHDFSGFRKLKEQMHGVSLAQWQWQYIGLEGEADLSPWLTSCGILPHYSGIAIFARSNRYHNPSFPWREIYKRYMDDAIFVGLQSEYAAFQNEVGAKIEYIPTSNLLEMARIIAPCKLVIANQSAPFWIAAGLGVNIVQETWAHDQNSVLPRPNIIYSRTEYETSKVMEKLEAMQL